MEDMTTIPTYTVYSHGKFIKNGIPMEEATAWIHQYMREKLGNTDEVRHTGIVSNATSLKHGMIIVYYYQKEEKRDGYVDWRTYPKRQHLFSIFED